MGHASLGQLVYCTIGARCHRRCHRLHRCQTPPNFGKRRQTAPNGAKRLHPKVRRRSIKL